MKYIYKDIIYVITSLGGITAIIIAISSWIGSRIAEKLALKWKHKYERELELIKAKVLDEREFYKSSLTLFASGHQHSQERRLKAIEVMWENMIKLRDYILPLTTFYSVLLPEEYNEIFERDFSMLNLSSITKKSLDELCLEMDKDVELQRPFLGEHLWSLFFIYRAFIMRNSFLFIKAREKGDIKEWHIDKNLIHLLKISLTKEDFEKINFNKMGSMEISMSLLEQRILQIADQLISGEYASQASIREAKRLMETAKNIELSSMR